MYVDKLDGLVDTGFFEKMSNHWREEQKRCQREIERRQNADQSYKEEGVALLDLARNAHRLFATQEPREKRRLLNFVLSNCTWEDGKMVAGMLRSLLGKGVGKLFLNAAASLPASPIWGSSDAAPGPISRSPSTLPSRAVAQPSRRRRPARAW
jgi:hypothetical protein